MAFEIARLTLEVLGGADARVPDRWLSGALGEFAVPASKLSQFPGLIHRRSFSLCLMRPTEQRTDCSRRARAKFVTAEIIVPAETKH
jgi:hypothetical protein